MFRNYKGDSYLKNEIGPRYWLIHVILSSVIGRSHDFKPRIREDPYL